MSDKSDDMDYEPVKKSARKAKKVSADWDDESINKLICAVEVHECLWNAGLKEYRNKTHRDTAWSEVCNAFDGKYPVNEISAKWANLRIQFKSYAAKFKKTKSGQGFGEYQVHWRFFKPMMFIATAETEQSTSTESNLVSSIKFLIIFHILSTCFCIAMVLLPRVQNIVRIPL